MTTTYKLLKLEEITVDQSLQVRKTLDAPTVERYAAQIGEGAKFPPLTCGWVKGEGPIYLIDGFHRHAAYSRLPQLSGRAQDCFVKTYDSFDDMFEDALQCNMKHGLNLTEEERRDAIIKVIQRHPEESQRQLADRCGCARSTIQKYQNQVAERGHLERPEKVTGKDGKEYPTTVTRKYEKPAIIQEPTAEDFDEPADSASVTPRTVKCPRCGKTATIMEANDHHSTWEPDSESFNPDIGIYEKWYCSEDCMERYKRATNIKGFGVGEELPDYGEDDEEDEALITAQKPKTCRHFCAGGCGTPIYDELKDAPDSTYFRLQKNGMTLWFCSEDCYKHSWHCPANEKQAEEKRGREPEETEGGNGAQSAELRAGSEPEDAKTEDSNTVTCEKCGKTIDFNAAMDFERSGWHALDPYFDRWLCPDCGKEDKAGMIVPVADAPAGAGPLLHDFAHPDELDPAALAVPACPFDPTHRPRLGRVSNNGYNVRCWDCDKEGRLVHTYTRRSWKQAYKDWGCYSDEVRPLEDMLKND